MMASTCISRSCVDTYRFPVRASYVNMYKWPESDFEFVRSMNSSKTGERSANIHSTYGHPRVVDSISCRQMYLRSYTFSREEDYKDNDNCTLIKCLGRRSRKRQSAGGSKRAKVLSCSAAVASIFRQLLSCTTKVDVVI